jgi:NTP pyrophosphatase (non-canonical NTP hydrolase)
MNLFQYQRAAVRTEKTLDTHSRFLHARLGMITELGEFTTEVKRTVIYDKPLDDERLVNMGEELGDLMWYNAIPFNALGRDMMLPEQELSFLQIFMSHAYPGQDARSVDHRAAQHLLDVLAGEMVIEVGHYSQNTRNHNHHPAMLNVVRINGLVRDTCDLLHMDLGVVLDHNIDKLKKRFPDAFSAQAAEARADKDGIDARNS